VRGAKLYRERTLITFVME